MYCRAAATDSIKSLWVIVVMVAVRVSVVCIGFGADDAGLVQEFVGIRNGYRA